MRHKRFFVPAFVLLAAAGAGYFYFNRSAQNVIDKNFERMIANGSYDAIDYEDFKVDLFGNINMKNLRLVKAGQEVKLREIAVTDLDYTNEIPHTLNVKITGIGFPAGIPFMGTDPMSSYM